MAVTIELDLDASGATGSIGAVAASLKGLEHVANDLEIDFDVDVSDITGEIEDFSDALDNINFDTDGLLKDFNDVVDEIQDTEIEMEINTPDGVTNDGDSSGNDPPRTTVNVASGAYEAAESITDGGAAGDKDGSGFVGGGHEFSVSESNLRNLQKKLFHNVQGTVFPQSNLPIPDDMINAGTAQGARTGFGLEPSSMSERREFQFGTGEIESLLKSDIVRENESNANPQQFKQAIAGLFGADKIHIPDDYMDGESWMMNYALQSRNGFGLEPDSMMDKRRAYFNSEEIQDMMSQSAAADAKESSGSFFDGDTDSWTEQMKSEAEMIKSRSNLPDADLRDVDKGPKFTFGDSDLMKRVKSVSSMDDAMKGLSNSSGILGRKLRSLKPTMGKYMQLMAAMLPIAVALGTQLLGLAAAAGAVGAAGAAIMGLGLLGHGSSMTGSIEAAKQQVKGLKEELFNVFQPAMQQFAPIQARMFDAIPSSMEGISEEMEGLTAYEDTLFAIGDTLASGMEQAVQYIVANEEAIGGMVEGFTEIVTTGILKFLTWLIDAAIRNKQLIIDLGASMVAMAAILYNVAMAIGRVIAALKPAFMLIAKLTGVLNNKFVVGLMTALAVSVLLAVGFAKVAVAVYGLVSAVQLLVAFLGMLGGGSILGGIVAFFTIMLSYIEATIIALYQMYGAATTAAMALAATGVGALVVGGGLLAGMGAVDAIGSKTGGGGGGKNVYNDNRSYTFNNNDSDYGNQKRTEEIIGMVGERNSAMEIPDGNGTPPM
jgi:hypothetical protein